MTGARASHRSRAPLAAGALALILLAALLQGQVDAAIRRGDSPSPLLYLPSGRYLKVVSLGFDGILADALYLWSIQYYSNYSLSDRYEYLEHIYKDIITELDPHYLDAYLTGSLIMSAEARRPDLALALLDKGIERNPSAWILAFDAGFFCYQDLRDYARAGAYFEKALGASDVNPQVRRFYAEMSNRAGDPRASLREWIAIHQTATDDYVRAVSWNHVHDLKVRIDLEDLGAAVAAFRSRTDRPPRRLEELVRAGFLASLPLDPEERPYDYDPLAGRVAYSGSRVLGR
jgi:tetratricopeptide (TPR) repeat protein